MKRSILAVVVMGSFGTAWAYTAPSTYLGECGARMKAVAESRVGQNEERQILNNLAKKVIQERALHVSEASGLLSPFFAQEQDQEKASLFQLAKNAEALHPRLSMDQWNQTVTLWSRVLETAANRVDSLFHEDYCGPVATMGALGMDATRMVWGPLGFYTFKDGWGGGENRPWVRQSLVFIAGTVPSLLSDMGLLLPNTYLRTRDMLTQHPERDAKNFKDALRIFENHVTRLGESDHG